MYRAAYSPDFYRTLHAFAHARFRVDRALEACAAGVLDGQMTRVDVRTIRSGLGALVRLPALSWRVSRQARRERSGVPTATVGPLLSRQAAALPSEQQL